MDDGSSRVRPLIAHSHTTATLHPCSRSARRFSSSLSRFRSIFSRHHSRRVPGHLKRLQSCPCQKQPFTCTTARYLGRTISGFPGSSLTCRRNRNPDRWSNLRISISGRVCLPRIPDIIRLRVALSTTSGTDYTRIGKGCWPISRMRSREVMV